MVFDNKSAKNMKITACRKAHFNATHRLNNPNWSDEKNEKIFGTCNNPNYHGHNYNLIVKVKGEIDPETGYVMDMKHLKEIIDEHIVSRYDHKNLYLDVDDFSDLNPSAENIAIKIWEILRQNIEMKFDLSIELYETERNFVEYDGN
jgi:6-pyruvoyltetrahydropterin/6-carboxytetrahydropterin synthase